MTEKIMDKVMSDMELDAVVGGAGRGTFEREDPGKSQDFREYKVPSPCGPAGK